MPVKLSSSMSFGLLLSIESPYVDEIIDGSKRYEYRNVPFPLDFDIVFVSVSGSRCDVSLFFKSNAVICASIDRLWELTGEYAGMSKRCFYSYFKTNRDHGKKGYAIEISKLYTCQSFKSYNVLKNTTLTKKGTKRAAIRPNSWPIYFNKVKKVLETLRDVDCLR